MSSVLWPNIRANLPPLIITVLAILAYRQSLRAELWREAYRRLKKNRLAMGAMTILALYTAVVFLDSVSWQKDLSSDPRTVVDLLERPHEKTYSAPLDKMTTGLLKDLPLDGKHVLGTDAIGEDVLFKTLKGFRTSFIIGGFACAIAIPIALIFGLIAGYYGKFIDDVVQFLYTVFASVPDILLIIATVLMIGKGLGAICFALGITSWIGLCRLIRGETLKHRDREYVRAAKALGVNDFRILTKHILPNLLPTVIISITLLFSQLALYEVVLAYLGVGVGADVGSWGNMIDGARDELTRDPAVWWGLVSATGCLLLVVLSLNVVADGLRDAIDPRLRTE